MSKNTDQAAPTKRITANAAILDLALVFAATTGAYFGERWLRDAGLVQLPEATNGLLGVAASVIAVTVLVIARGQPWSDLGFRRPRRLWTLPIWAIGMLAVFLIVQNGSALVLENYIDIPRPELSRYDFLYQNVPALLAMLGIIWMTASLPEEVVYRGFVFDRLSRIFGAGSIGTIPVIVLSAAFFGAAHFHAGIGGMIITATMGLVWGVMYVLAGRNLWPLILGHYFTDAIGGISLFFVRGSSIGAG